MKLPTSGSVSIQFASPIEKDFQFLLTSWTRTPELLWYNGQTAKVGHSPIQKNAPVGTDQVEVKEVIVKSHDGTMVPMTIIHKKGLVLDGNNMVSMSAYGAYGMQDNPYFWPEDLVRYNEGVVRAVPHVRGGGIYGEEWHKAGQMATKPNTWKDVIACAEYLVQQRYTNPQKIMLSGGSAGGITVGRSITERPDLFRAATINVGCLDMVGAERAPNGYGNITEFGSVKTEEGFKALYEMSTYHHIKDGEKYPAILFNHGFNDNRVPVYHSAKAYARFRQASASGMPVLMNINFDSGHGAQESTADLIQRFTYNMAFFYMMMGKPGFQLKKPM